MKILFLLLLVTSNLINAQSLSSDWVPISLSEESTIYLNSSKITPYGNEISVWAIEQMNDVNQDGEIHRIRTHYLFNKMKKRYAEVGIIYYDKKGSIINRSSKSNLQGTSAAFMTPIKSNPNVEIIYDEVISFIITGKIKNISEVDTNEKQPALKEDTVKIETPQPKTKLEVNEKNETPTIVKDDEANRNNRPSKRKIDSKKNVKPATTKEPKDLDNVVDLSVKKWENIPKITKKLEIKKKPKIKSIAKRDEVRTPINISVPKEAEYNYKNERAIKNAIFTDGNLYTFQVSSWRTKAFAERELNKLLSEGYNAFIVSVKPKHKRNIWHRVRVGYFDSLQEAKRVQRLVGKR